MAKHGRGPAQAREYDWLNDPFDEGKQEEDYQRALASRRIGCLVAALVIIVVFVAVCVLGCMALPSLVTLG